MQIALSIIVFNLQETKLLIGGIIMNYKCDTTPKAYGSCNPIKLKYIHHVLKYRLISHVMCPEKSTKIISWGRFAQ